jgi:RimJ/RimL family protein N-acetyltransferase
MEGSMSLALAVPCSHTYYGESKIDFSSDDEGLRVTINTERLYMRSVEATESEYDRYADLFGSEDVMGKFATGQTKTREEMRTRIEGVWVERWRKRDPYSGLAVFKNDTDDFLGHVVLGHSDAPGKSELAYLFGKEYWNKRYGSEAVAAIVKEYAPATVEKGYLLDGSFLKTIVATARPDNPASVRILEKVGMRRVCAEEKYGAIRCHYAIDL